MKHSQRLRREIALARRFEETRMEGMLKPWKGTGRKKKITGMNRGWGGLRRHAEGEREWMRAIDKGGERMEVSGGRRQKREWGRESWRVGRRDQTVFTCGDSRERLRRGGKRVTDRGTESVLLKNRVGRFASLTRQHVCQRCRFFHKRSHLHTAGHSEGFPLSDCANVTSVPQKVPWKEKQHSNCSSIICIHRWSSTLFSFAFPLT